MDHGVLIEGSINIGYFTFTVKDLISLMRFSSSDNKFNIQGTLEEFIRDYKFKPLNIKFEPDDIKEDTFQV